MAGAVVIGTSGWSYRNWHGRFYPARLPRNAELAYLAQRLHSVEVNGTFYSMTRPEHCDAWRAQVPADFLFAIKGSRYITHMLKLRNFEPALGNFFAQGILRLGRQLGPILWQLPEMVHFDAERAATFFAALPDRMSRAEAWATHHDRRTSGRAALHAPDGHRLRLRHALEMRHDSWHCPAALALLRAHNIALVTADSAGRYPFTLTRTADFVYVRLHGSQRMYTSGYSDAELAIWARRIRRWCKDGRDVYVYFDNDAKVHAPTDALRLATVLGARADTMAQAGV